MNGKSYILIGEDSGSAATMLADALVRQGRRCCIRQQSAAAFREAISQEEPSAIILTVGEFSAEWFSLLSGTLQRMHIPIAAIVPEGLPMLYRQLRLFGVSMCISRNMSPTEMGRMLSTSFFPQTEAEPTLLPQKILESIAILLRRFGIATHLRGYLYLQEAIMRVYDAPVLIHCMTRELYPMVADSFGTTATRVERAIRHAIELAWAQGGEAVLTEYFGGMLPTLHGKPTNSELISMIADHLRVENGYTATVYRRKE